jgi:hypothetical protein
VASSEGRRLLVEWLRHFGVGFLAYVTGCAAAAWALRALEPGALRTIVVLLPVLPGWFLIWTTARLYRRSDEYIRLCVLQSIGWAASLTAAWTMAYAFLELAGLPKLSLGWVSTVGWGIFCALMVRLVAAGR